MKRSLTRLPQEFPEFDSFRKPLSLEEKFEALPCWKQVILSLGIAVPALYFFLGALRAFSVLAYHHAPIYEPWVDWWWTWFLK